jgi:predicted glutamine amidotransferase
MCGLVGVVGKGSLAADRFFKVLLQLDVVRGEHSTGVLLVSSGGSESVHKAVGAPSELYDSIKFNKSLSLQNNVMLGHNRYASCGAINKRNAHPFVHGNITGAHNGTITTQHKLLDYVDFKVDSDNILYNISKVGIQATTPLLGGAYALTWWDSDERTINIVRNDERPMYYAYSRDRLNFFWASEKWMLQVASEKSHIVLGNINKLQVAKHISLNVPLEFQSTYPMLAPMKIQEVVEYVIPKPRKYKKSSTKSSRGSTKNGGKSKKKPTLVGGTDVSEEAYHLVSVNGKPVTNTRYLRITRCGCMACGVKPQLSESPDLYWLNNEQHLCIDCFCKGNRYENW